MFHEFEVELYEAALRHDSKNVEALYSLGNAYTRIGRYDEGLEVDARLSKMFPDNATVRYNLACSFALLSRTDEALEALRCAMDLGFDDDRLLATDPDLRSIRRDPRFQELIAPHP